MSFMLYAEITDTDLGLQLDPLTNVTAETL